MKYLFIYIFLLCELTFGFDVNIQIEPDEPVLGQPFVANFVIEYSEDVEPEISFDVNGLELIGRGNASTSMRSTYINGRFSSSRRVIVPYNLMPIREGLVSLRDVEVKLGDKSKKLGSKSFNVLKEARRPQDLFVVADVSKKEVYVGESILLRYYVYHRVGLTSLEIKKFPELTKFFKRFHQEKEQPERVSYGGEIFTRRIIYTTQLFPEKAGEFSIDPIHLNTTYQAQAQGFGGFGFGGGRLQQKLLMSPRVTILVKPLPIENVPSSFTGLVGVHQFDLQLARNKYVVNEPIELSLTVSGNGSLENYEAKSILAHPSIEEFESVSDLRINSDFTGTKNFKFTYLGRENTTLPKRSIEFSYFDPNLEKYVSIKKPIDEISILGQGAMPVEKMKKIDTAVASKRQDKVQSEAYLSELGFKLHNTLIIERKLIYFFLIFMLFLVIFINREEFSFKRSRVLANNYLDTILKTGKLTYQDYFEIFPHKDGRSIQDLLKKTSISANAQDELLRIFTDLEKKYSDGKIESINVTKKTLYELKRMKNATS
jgi:hypothetical protein